MALGPLGVKDGNWLPAVERAESRGANERALDGIRASIFIAAS